MVEVTPLEAKIIKQVEYYFGDINLSRDKFMKEAIKQNDGWISMETMLKFNRLKSLTDDPELIRTSLLKSTTGLIEVGADGLRRNPKNAIPETFETAVESCKDSSVYVKGFPADTKLDDIIEWLETHGGKTLNVHMRRFPKDRKFKGSIFVIFENKEFAEKFLSCPGAATYKEQTMIRMYQKDYWESKKLEKEAKLATKAQRQSNADAQLCARMTLGALLELSGLPNSQKESHAIQSKDVNNTTHQISKSENENGVSDSMTGEAPVTKGSDTDGQNTQLTVLSLKQWLIEKLGTHIPVAWIDVDPAQGKAVVRFKQANLAEKAWAKLKEEFGDSPVVYMGSELTGRVISGDEEKNHWKLILASQQHKSQKRRGARQGARPSGPKKRRND